MLSCASDCIAALAEDPRQAQAIAEGGGLTMGLTMALQLKDDDDDDDDDDGGGAAAGDPVAKTLLLFEKVSTRAIFFGRLGICLLAVRLGYMPRTGVGSLCLVRARAPLIIFYRRV